MPQSPAEEIGRIQRTEIQPTLIRLIRTPSISGNEHDIAKFLFSALRSCGLDAELLEVKGTGPTVFASHRFARKGRKLLLYAHTDTVEPSEGWTLNPFAPTVKGRKIYGLGSWDMKGGLSAILAACRRLTKMDLQGELGVAFASDEELHSRGCDQLVRTGYLRGFDGAISAEPTGLASLEIGRRGRVVFEVNVTGRSSHGAAYSRGIDAVVEASNLVTHLTKLDFRRWKKIKGTASVLAIEGGTEFLSVPDKCRLLLDRYLVPGETAESALRQLLDFVRRLGSKARIRVAIKKRKTPYMAPYEISPNEAIVKAVRKASLLEVKRPKLSFGLSVADDNYLVTRAKIPTVTFGPDGGNYHAPDEYVDMPSVVAAANTYVKAGALFLGS